MATKAERLKQDLEYAQRQLDSVEDLSEKEHWQKQVARIEDSIEDYEKRMAYRLTTPMACW